MDYQQLEHLRPLPEDVTEAIRRELQTIEGLAPYGLRFLSALKAARTVAVIERRMQELEEQIQLEREHLIYE